MNFSAIPRMLGLREDESIKKKHAICMLYGDNDSGVSGQVTFT